MLVKEKIAKEIERGILKVTKQKIVSLHEPSFDKNDLENVADCIKSTYVSSFGKYILNFEKKISKITKSKYVVCTTNGTSALHLALVVAGVKKNDEVLIPSLTFVATSNAIKYAAAIPHFVEVETSNLGIDPVKLEQYLKENTFKKKHKTLNKNTGNIISALMPVHLFGHPSRIIELKKIAKKYNLILIEDAAEGLGSFLNSKHIGTFSKMGILSFNGNKIITTGGGGAILTNNKKLALKARYLSTTAKKNHSYKFIHTELGFNYRMPNINAALGCSQIKKLDNYLKRKRLLTKKYFTVFKDSNYFEFYIEPKNSKSNYWFQTIILKRKYKSHKNYILKYLNKKGISCRPAWSTLHKLSFCKNLPRMNLSVTEDLHDRIINIPSSPNLV